MSAESPRSAQSPHSARSPQSPHWAELSARLLSEGRWSRQKLALGALFGVALLAVSIATHASALGFPHVHDERFVQLLAGLVRTGKMSWGAYLVPPYNLHWIPFFKATFYAFASLFGFEPVAWHLVNDVSHAVLAAATGYLVAHYGFSRTGAAVTALLFAGAAIGRWDSSMVWISAGGIEWSLLCTVLSMAAVTRWRSPNATRWRWAMAASLVLSMGFFGPFLLLALVLPVQWRLVEPELWSDRAERRRWLIAWMAPIAIMGLAQAILITSSATAEIRQKPPILPLILVEKILGQFAIALGNLTVLDGAGDPLHQLRVAGPLAAIAFGLLLTLRPPGLRIATCFFLMAAIYSLVQNAGRTELNLEYALASGRYYTVITLYWCVALGALVDVLLRKDDLYRPTLIVLALLAPAYGWNQWRVTENAVTQGREIWQESIDRYQSARELTTALAQVGRDRALAIRLPEIPLELPPVNSVIFPLSAFVGLEHSPNAAWIRVLPAEEIRADDIQSAIVALNQRPEPLAREWSEKVEHFSRLQESISWLSGQALGKGETVKVPDFNIETGQCRFPSSQYVSAARQRPPARLTWVSVGEVTLEELDRGLAIIGQSNLPAANFWRSIFEQTKRQKLSANSGAK